MTTVASVAVGSLTINLRADDGHAATAITLDEPAPPHRFGPDRLTLALASEGWRICGEWAFTCDHLGDPGSWHAAVDKQTSSVTDEANWDTAYVTELPNCDIHKQMFGVDVVAAYDASSKLPGSPWAFMCAECFPRFGIGLGLGLGQRLAVAA